MVNFAQNGTLRDNIVFGREFDEIFYRDVLHATALDQDITSIPGMDGSVVVVVG